MKIGLENLSQPKTSKTVSTARLYKAEVEMLEARIALESCGNELNESIEVQNNLNDIKVTVESHGIDDSLRY